MVTDRDGHKLKVGDLVKTQGYITSLDESFQSAVVELVDEGPGDTGKTVLVLGGGQLTKQFDQSLG